jgi:NAD(P)-dependent dehydrogenase (short-subunit alcohol dehydrogenase family)
MTDELRLDDQVAIVTGAGAGLGRQHALALASRGARVVVNDFGTTVSGDGSSDGPAQAVVKEIEALGGEAVADTSSVATPEGGAAIVARALDTWDRLDIVVNNAGFLRDKPFEQMDVDTWRAVLDVHLHGAFNVTQPAWRHMVDRHYGRVVFTTSSLGIFGNGIHANYGSAKMGIVGLTRMLSVEGRAHGVQVNAVAPAAMTRMTEIKTDKPRAADVMGRGLIERMGPEMVSPLVVWLAHPDCGSNGEIFSVGGGRIARIFIAEADGWCAPTLSPEVVRDAWSEICDPDRPFHVFKDIMEEMKLYKLELTGE